jgi:hypothetical protein
MKKLLLVSLLFAVSFVGISQTYVLEEFFDNPDALPETWTTIDQDGDGYIWIMNTWETEVYTVSESWIDGPGPLTPNNYLISPLIDLTALTGDETVGLRFTVQVASEDYPEEHYMVAVSTGSNGVVEDFTDTIFEETTSLADYYVWTERLVDLTDYKGEQIYLTWCHFNTTDMYKLLLDSVQVYYTTAQFVPTQNKESLVVYPNPANEKMSISGDFENAEIQISTINGKEVYRNSNFTKKTILDVSTFENGVYILNLITSEGAKTKKIVIAH